MPICTHMLPICALSALVVPGGVRGARRSQGGWLGWLGLATKNVILDQGQYEGKTICLYAPICSPYALYMRWCGLVKNLKKGGPA